jgi:alkyl sulfatase BDS1-like metallo-beta-lactamase superfamily hydrolase
MWWLLLLLSCGDPTPVQTERTLPTNAALDAHCEEVIGQPRIEQINDHIWVAIGWDLANTILIGTSDGNIIVDVGMHPTRARPVREALLAKHPGPVRAIVYTHSHIDHVGGADVWAEADTRIWATETFDDHFYKQYGTFLPAEQARAARQFAWEMALEDVPCSALGRRVDLEGNLRPGVRMPTDHFTGQVSFTIGDTEVQLIEAHGETHDQLLVWLPEDKVLLPGDNWYEAFPNLYTIRGSAPRPVDDWIDSLDAMRRLKPEVMVPSHTRPVRGVDEVQAALRDYRDAIQWVRDAVVRGANDGQSIDQLAADIGLPDHLQGSRSVIELYGQLDWSVRAIYGNRLGWFDGQAVNLYPLATTELATRSIDAMGGPDAVRRATRDTGSDDARWRLHLLTLLEADGRTPIDQLNPAFAEAYEAIAATVSNTNGRGYLLRAAHERRHGLTALGQPTLTDAFVAAMPLSMLFGNLEARLKPEGTLALHESVVFQFPETRFVVTLRRGLAEVVEGDPLPGTPEPIATIQTDAHTWRRVATQRETALAAIMDRRLVIEGSQIGFLSFMSHFDRDLVRTPTQLP